MFQTEPPSSKSQQAPKERKKRNFRDQEFPVCRKAVLCERRLNETYETRKVQIHTRNPFRNPQPTTHPLDSHLVTYRITSPLLTSHPHALRFTPLHQFRSTFPLFRTTSIHPSTTHPSSIHLLFGERRESGSSSCDSWSLGSSPTDECEGEESPEQEEKRVLSDGVEDGKVEEEGDGDEQGIHSSPLLNSASPSLRPRPVLSRFASDPGRSSLSHSQSHSHSHTYAPVPPQRAFRPRGLTPLTPLTPSIPSSSHAASSGISPTAPHLHRPSGLPKSQPLSRALFARIADTPHSGMSPKGKGKGQKIIVPTKSFRTSFTLDMTASELARR
ncbi:hypothetical protein I312_103707 [Cryptococcus bacillisporus CA1280]|uniref:uncharacterized protein n=1 Tax=Cryptococcus bacillisporus CA1280 TaxID=1296109 RepID=UPI0033690854